MTATIPRWLTIIGIGEDGIEGLSPTARTLIAQASFIVGGERHLGLLGQTKAETMAWPSPFSQGVAAICERRGRNVLVLASGDPFLYGVGSVLAAEIPAEEMLCLPAPSSLSLAAARLGWALQECETLSLHGRPLERLLPFLRPGAKLLALSWDESTPARIAELMRRRGLGTSRLHILEALGGPRERRTSFRADEDAPILIDPLNLVAIEVEAAPGARFIPLTPGLPDEWFESDGQITKREVRAITLSSLAPWPGAVLWDIGAGSGSVAIEWMLAHPRNRAHAVEQRHDRAARILRNAAALGVPDLEVTVGEALASLGSLPAPDAIFIGGGGNDVIRAAWDLLPSGGRIVVNAVTVESQSHIAAMQARHRGSLTSIAIGRADQIGRYRAWRQAMPVTQWVADKP
jgi:precorrin-6Y C5,15-methyltransferase (decarboxylating)